MKYFFSVLISLLFLASGAPSIFAKPTLISVSVNSNVNVPAPKPLGKNFQLRAQTYIADYKVENYEVIITGRKIGKTILTVKNDNGYFAEYLINVVVENLAYRKVEELINGICPDGKVTFVLTPSTTESAGKLILQGSVPTKSRGERLEKLFTALDYTVINMLSITGSQQVQLFVRVAEVVKGNPMSVGITLGGKSDGWLISDPGTNLIASLVDGINGGEISSPQSDTFNLGFNFSGASYFGVLSIMEGHNLAKILAQPTLVVESGQSARFHAGGEVPIPIVTDNTIEIDYKSYGVIIAFTPDILENGNIHINLEQEVPNLDWANSVNFGSGSVPALRTRITKTSLKLKDGESFMVSGLLHEEIRSVVSQIPVLGDIPILGALFRSSTYEKNQTELAIVVTPRIVNPIAVGETIHLPGEQLTTPSPFDAFLLGKVVAKTNNEAAYALLGTAGLEMP